MWYDVGGRSTRADDPVTGAVLQLDEAPGGKERVHHRLAGHADTERPSTSHMRGVRESAQRGLLGWCHDWERAQDTVGGAGEPVGEVHGLRERTLDLGHGSRTRRLNGGLALALGSTARSEHKDQEEGEGTHRGLQSLRVR